MKKTTLFISVYMHYWACNEILYCLSMRYSNYYYWNIMGNADVSLGRDTIIGTKLNGWKLPWNRKWLERGWRCPVIYASRRFVIKGINLFPIFISFSQINTVSFTILISLVLEGGKKNYSEKIHVAK